MSDDPIVEPSRRLDRLMIVAADRPSAWIDKGEVIDRYFNPGNLFGQVDLVLLNDDRPDPAALRRLAGDARLDVHNMSSPRGLLRRSLGYRPALLRGWASGVVQLAQAIRPQLLRCYGTGLNAYAASEVRRRLGVPYVVSLHINPAEDVFARAGARDRIVLSALRAVERLGLRQADLVLPVYKPIVPYLEGLGIDRYEVAYNMLNAASLAPKQSYELGAPARVISVGRQFAEKNPVNLVHAIAERDHTSLTLVGDGPEHQRLARLAGDLAPDRITLHRSVDNSRLCEMLTEHDIFATHTEYWELSKAVLEAMLAGLPVILNRRHGRPVPELTTDICSLVEDSPSGFGQAIDRLLADHAEREALGRRAAEHAWRTWSPEVTEGRYADIYRAVASVDGHARPSDGLTP